MSEPVTAAGKYTFAGVAGFVLAAALTVPGSQYFEGYVSRTYRDPVGIPTACWGETGAHIQYGMEFTLAECVQMHNASLWRTWQGLGRCITAPLLVREMAALLSWAHNVGVGAACGSTAVRMIRAGVPAEVWCLQLPRWNKATVMGVKVVLPGLVTRRQAEMTMCLHGHWGIAALDAKLPAPDPAPQATPTVAILDSRRHFTRGLEAAA